MVSSILVLDDRDADRELLSTVLGYAGYRVLEAATGEEALELARRERPDLIVTDILMPAMNGYEFVRLLRSEPEVGDTLVAFTTANYVEGEILDLARACGVSRFIPKPCEPERIVKLVAEALQESHQTPAGVEAHEFDRAQLRVLNDKLVEKSSDLEQANAERQRLVAELLDSQERERARIAELVHDEPIQAMTAVGMQLDMVIAAMGDGEHIERLRKLRAHVSKATSRLRTLLGNLQPPTLEGRSLERALGALLDDAREEDSLEVELVNRQPREPPEAVGEMLFRVAREALINARKHAEASSVTVYLDSDESGFELAVEDDGKGFLPGEAARVRRDHLGLPSMRERVEVAGGSLALESSPGEGSAVRARIPDRTSVAPTKEDR